MISFFFSYLIWEFVIDFCVFGFGNLLEEQRDEMRGMKDRHEN